MITARPLASRDIAGIFDAGGVDNAAGALHGQDPGDICVKLDSATFALSNSPTFTGTATFATMYCSGTATFTGMVTAPTATTGTSTTQIATTAYVQNAIGATSSGVSNINVLNGLSGGGSGNVTIGIAANGIANASLATMAAHTYKGNNTGSSATSIDVTAAQLLTDIGAAPLAFPSITGAMTITGGTTDAYTLTLIGNDTSSVDQGAQLKISNSNAPAGVRAKSLRVNSLGGFEIINSAYTLALLGITDSGIFTQNFAALSADTVVTQFEGVGAGFRAISRVFNNSTADNSAARMQVVTPVANMFGLLEVNNGTGGAGSLTLSSGAGCTLGMSISTGAGPINLSPATSVTAPTPAINDNSTKLATTAYVDGAGFTQVGTGAVVRTVNAKLKNEWFDLADFGTVDTTGTADQTSIINTAISAIYTLGGGTLRLPPGTLKVTGTIVPKSFVRIVGQGTGSTTLLTTGATPFAQTSGTQCVHAGLQGVTFTASGNTTATVMSFTCLQDYLTRNLEFKGFSAGILFKIAGATVTSFDDTTFAWNNSNSIFSYHEDWEADGCATCFSLAGAYGSVATPSPPNSSNQPAIVTTLNRYTNMSFRRVTTAGINIIKCCDTETFTNQTVFLTATTSILGIIGNDATFPGNNYVNDITWAGVASVESSFASLTFFTANNWTFGNRFTVNHDINPTTCIISNGTVGAGVTLFAYNYTGTNYTSTGLDANGFNTNFLDVSLHEYPRLDNGTATFPIWGFANDGGNGIYLPAAGVLGFSKGISTGSNGGTVGSVKINGNTSGSYTITASASGSPLYPGTGTNDSATAGYVGEYISATIASGSAVSLVTATGKTITSISLTAGDWDVFASVGFTGGATTTVAQLIGSISTANNTVDQSDTKAVSQVYAGTALFATGNVQLPAGPTRLLLGVTTTVYLVAYASFATSTCSAFGTIGARRVR